MKTTALIWVYGILLALLAVLIGISQIPYLSAPISQALLLFNGVCMASLIAVFFMGLNESAPLVRVVAGGSLVWVALMFIPTFADYLTR